MRFSIIAPTFQRPDEVTEFLESLLQQDYEDFEVILGDGTPGDELRPLLRKFEGNKKYPLSIVYEEYLSVSDARNEAAKIARGEWLIFMDSDCIIPSQYLKKVDEGLEDRSLDVFGGPDRAHTGFSTLQKAISFSMTSIFTTGGIRGSKTRVGAYHPRGFNMGMKKSSFKTVGGYSDFRCGEDIELSIRLIKAGFKVGLIPKAYVYHKRRTSLKQFFHQVYRFGAARINIWQRHSEELKLTHFFPLAFTIFTVLTVVGVLFGNNYAEAALILLLIYLMGVWIQSTVLNTDLAVGVMSVITSVTMLFGYGWGFLSNWWVSCILRRKSGLKL